MSIQLNIHELKTWPEYYEKVITGAKTFEIRKNDRDYKVGELLMLREWDPATEEYTGRSAGAGITYITDFGQKPGFIVMAIHLMLSSDWRNFHDGER